MKKISKELLAKIVREKRSELFSGWFSCFKYENKREKRKLFYKRKT